MATLIPNLPQAAVIDDSRSLTAPFVGFLTAVFRICFAQQESGATAQRPVEGLYVGRRYFDTTLTKPIWISALTPAIVWVDATGAPV